MCSGSVYGLSGANAQRKVLTRWVPAKYRVAVLQAKYAQPWRYCARNSPLLSLLLESSVDSSAWQRGASWV